MSLLDLVLLSAWMNVCGVWLVLLAAQRRVGREGLMLLPAPPEAPADEPDSSRRPSVAVIVPARNEAATLDACLESIRSQDYRDLQIVIVDDRSEDATFAAAQRIAATDSRVVVKRVDDLPAGWMGKSHALWTGAQGVEADWLLFVDADCTLHPSAVRTVVDDAVHRDVDLLTLWPHNAAQSFWEHMLIPLCGAIIALWFGSQGTGRPNRGPAFANGQFLLVRREAYTRIDGHRAVRQALIEDVPLAEHARRHGLRLHVAAGRHLVSVRMYDRYIAIRDGWARIYVGALRSPSKIVLSIAWLIAGSLLPFVMLPLLLLARRDAPHSSTTLTAALIVCITHFVLMMIVSFRFWGFGRCRRGYLLLYPVSVIMVVRILARAWWWMMIRRRVPWRDRTYVIDRRGRLVL